MNETLLAQMDLSGCPESIVFDPSDPDWSLEDRYFPDWECPLASIARGRPSMLRVLEEEGRPVLDHYDKTDRCLVTGDALWRDYTVEAYVRQMATTSQPDADDPHRFLGRSGLMVRYQNLRQYYFFCMEGYDRVVLYRRDHAHWHVLDDMIVGIDRSRYHHLKVECRGDLIVCTFDGKWRLMVQDEAYRTGRAGIRTCTRSRFYEVKATATAPQHAAWVDTRTRAEKQVAEEREKYPKMALWRRIDTKPFGGGTPVFADIRGSGQKELLLLQDPSGKGDVPRIRALSWEGELVWEQVYPDLRTLSFRRTLMEDIDGDGVQELASVSGEGLCLVDARTGQLKAQTPLPESGPFLGGPGALD